jgi:hypothetical protein
MNRAVGNLEIEFSAEGMEITGCSNGRFFHHLTEVAGERDGIFVVQIESRENIATGFGQASPVATPGGEGPTRFSIKNRRAFRPIFLRIVTGSVSSAKRTATLQTSLRSFSQLPDASWYSDGLFRRGYRRGYKPVPPSTSSDRCLG